ncbi:phosphoglucosamine mutase [Desertivirga arenae]|uniref:phosphoglucosamine mutase n=1 Tax=Desertivirga arenae TaxID=2810309 RepID=UPI001A958BC1|nr:phosphoglucosamine mutase [Pedobacter sp. SYSU D00823]
MTLIKSISGIRGTIGGESGNALTPIDVVKFAAAFGQWVLNKTGNKKIVIGRDARISGPMVRDLIVNTLVGMGIDVVDLGLSATPTVEIAVPDEKAGGGIIITASHNPKQWNALKLLNSAGEFISDADGKELLAIAESEQFTFAEVDELGKVITDDFYLEKHIQKILALPLVDVDAIKAAGFRITVDSVNSVGGIFVPPLLQALGVKETHQIHCTPDGNFPHNPEPLPEHLVDLSKKVVETGSALGIAVDPDVDRLCFVCEDGSMFGEEYTLVAISDYVLGKTPGSTVSNLSSTQALEDITSKKNCTYAAAAVGEVNVVAKMKEVNAIIGGEGNGGVIYPELHYGRDALVGIALFLSHLATQNTSISKLRDSYPRYYMAKRKIVLQEGLDPELLLTEMHLKYLHLNPSTIDGLKIQFGKKWVHLRKSNTEPIIRLYAESDTKEGLDSFVDSFYEELMKVNNQIEIV